MLHEWYDYSPKILGFGFLYGTNIELVHVLYLLLGIEMILND